MCSYPTSTPRPCTWTRSAKEHLPWLARYGIKGDRLTDAVCILNLGLDYRPPLETHLTAYGASLQKMNQFDHDRHGGVMHDEMLGLICWTSLSDPALAPEGRHALNIVVEGPYQLAGTDWNREREPYIEKAIKYYGRITPDLADHIEVAELLTPIDYERRLLMPGGAIYDINMDLSASAVFRPSSKSRSIEGLYLVCASTHPGGGGPHGHRLVHQRSKADRRARMTTVPGVAR